MKAGSKLDVKYQLHGTFEAGATQRLAGENAEPDFDLVEPACRGGV
jgi:hypothetical protein